MDDDAFAGRLDAYEALLEQSQLGAFLHRSSLPGDVDEQGPSVESEQSGAHDVSEVEVSDSGNESGDDNDEDADASEGSVSWSQNEINIFLHSLARHSRLRPDLIADDLRSGKSMAQVNHLIFLFEKQKKEIGQRSPNRSLLSYKGLIRCPAAFEVSREWCTFEDRAARQLQAWQEVQRVGLEDREGVQSDASTKVSWDEQVSNVLLWMRHTPLLDANASQATYQLHGRTTHQEVFGFSVGDAIGTMVGNTSRSRQKPVLTLSQFARDHCAPDFDKIRRRKESVTSFAISLLGRAIELGLVWVCEKLDEIAADGKTVIARATIQRLPFDSPALLSDERIVLVWCDSMWRSDADEEQANEKGGRHNSGLYLMEGARNRAAMRLLCTLGEDELKGLYTLLSASEPSRPVTTEKAQRDDSSSQQASDDQASGNETSPSTSKRKTNAFASKTIKRNGKRVRLAESYGDRAQSEEASDTDDSDALSESAASVSQAWASNESQSLPFAAYETIDDVAMRTRQRLLRFIAIGVHPRQVALHLQRHIGLFNFSACAGFLTTLSNAKDDQKRPQKQAKGGPLPGEPVEMSISFRTLIHLRSSLESYIRRVIELLDVHAKCSSFLTSKGHISADDISAVLLQMRQMDRVDDEIFAHRCPSDTVELNLATDSCEWTQFDPTSNLSDNVRDNSIQQERNFLEGIRKTSTAVFEDDDSLNDEIDDEDDEEEEQGEQDSSYRHLGADEARVGEVGSELGGSEAHARSDDDVPIDAPERQHRGGSYDMAESEKWRKVDEFDLQQSKKQEALLWHLMGCDVPKEQTWHVSTDSGQAGEDDSDDRII